MWSDGSQTKAVARRSRQWHSVEVLEGQREGFWSIWDRESVFYLQFGMSSISGGKFRGLMPVGKTLAATLSSPVAGIPAADGGGARGMRKRRQR